MLDEKLIKFENERLENTKKLNQAMDNEPAVHRISKRAKKNLEKLQGNKDLDEFTKQEMMKESSVKRQKTTDTQSSKLYIEGQRNTQNEKPGASSLWDEHEKSFLEDVTMNFMDDDEVAGNIKGKTVMKWDKLKKKYTLTKVDRDGRVMSGMRNESGKKIGKDDKHVDIYKRWQ